jgi:hypothetical protein
LLNYATNYLNCVVWPAEVPEQTNSGPDNAGIHRQKS